MYGKDETVKCTPVAILCKLFLGEVPIHRAFKIAHKSGMQGTPHIVIAPSWRLNTADACPHTILYAEQNRNPDENNEGPLETGEDIYVHSAKFV